MPVQKTLFFVPFQKFWSKLGNHKKPEPNVYLELYSLDYVIGGDYSISARRSGFSRCCLTHMGDNILDFVFSYLHRPIKNHSDGMIFSDVKGKNMSDMQSGTVKFFNTTKGFGFIQPESGNDVFVHISALHQSGIDSLNEGDKVQFTTAKNERTGKIAADKVVMAD